MARCIFCDKEGTYNIEGVSICAPDVMILLKSIMLAIKSNPEFLKQIKDSIDTIKKSV